MRSPCHVYSMYTCAGTVLPYCTIIRTAVVGSHCYAREVCVAASGGACAIYVQTTLEARGWPFKSILICLGAKVAEKESMCLGTAVQVHYSTYYCSMHASTVRLEVPWPQQYPAILHTPLGPVRQRRPIRAMAGMPPSARQRCCRMSLGKLSLISSKSTTFLHAARARPALWAF